MKTIGIFLNQQKDPDCAFTRLVIERLSRHDCKILLPERYREVLAGFEKVDFSSRKERLARADFMLALGGDGTILSIAGLCAEKGIPVLGINIGTVGFMSEIEKDELDRLDQLFTGKYTLEDRMMIETNVSGKKTLFSLNECCISRDHGFHILTLELYLGEEKLCDFKADGVIFSTPTGSTGYSFSAGGALVDSRLDCIGVKAICPYLLNNSHHLVFHPDTVLKVKNIATKSGRLYASSDGREEVTLSEGDELTIRKAPISLKVIRFSEKINLHAFFRKF